VTAQSIQNSLDTVMQRIDAMIDELVELRQSIQILGQKVNSSTNIEDTPVQPQKRSAMEILAQEPTFSMFKSAEEVDAYLHEERASWED